MKIFIICGEKSGNETLYDILTYFFNCIKSQKIEEKIEIKGVVSDEYATKFNISQICNSNYFSVIGFGDIIFNLPSFFDKINDISYFIADYQPDLIISIDSYELSIRIAKKTRKLLKKRNIGYKDVQFWHIGAPSVWAYWKFRAKKIAKYYDKLFYFFPFEGQYFKPLEKHTNIYHKGFKSEFVGFNYAFQWPDHNIIKSDKTIGFMIGSRKKEIERHIDLILNTIFRLKMLDSGYKFVIFATVDTLDDIKNYFSNIKNVEIVCNEEDKIKKIQECMLVVAKNGSNNVVIGALETPMITFYKTSFITWLFVKLCVKIKHFNLLNITLSDDHIPEFIQNKATPENLLQCINYLLKNKEAREKQIRKNRQAIMLMKSETYYKSHEIIANEILKMFK